MRIQTMSYAYVTGINGIRVIHSFNYQIDFGSFLKDYQPFFKCHPLRDKLKEELSL